MYINKVALTNFRGFKGEHEVVLHREVTVLAGLNGSGKSAVLDAVASLLSGVVSLTNGHNRSWFAGGHETNIHQGADSAYWAMEACEGDNASVWVGLGAWSVAKPASWGQRPPDGFGFLEAWAQTWQDSTTRLPALGYVHSSSTRAPVRHTEPMELRGRLIAWRGVFDSESLQFSDLEAWFEAEENLENQFKIKRNSLAYALPSLKAVRGAVQRAFSTLHGCKLGVPGVLRHHTDDPLGPARGQLTMQKGRDTLFINQLSDGERRLVFLVLDTARRMVVLNPDVEDPTLVSGVLAVDEVELHLHPQWQRTVVAALRAAFPGVQLLVTTHSPTVLSSVPNESIVFLRDGAVVKSAPRTYGRDPNTILETFQDTPLRPDVVQRDLDALFEEIDKTPAKARKRLKALQKKLGADDPDLVRAQAMIELLEG